MSGFSSEVIRVKHSIEITDRTRVFVLTGAGVSAESGIPTFRDANGLWEKHPVEAVASPEGFAADPTLVWRFYSERRASAAGVEPNRAHYAIAALEQRLGDRFMLATQNVDGLHQRAGSRRCIEMHGSLFRTKCSRCDRPAFDDRDVYGSDRLPGCSECHARGEYALLRPDIVWFGEPLHPTPLRHIHAFIEDAGRDLVFVAAGTSGAVYPAAGLVDWARRFGADTWLVNADRAQNSEAFAHFVEGSAGDELAPLFGV